MYRDESHDVPLLITAFRGLVIAVATEDGREVWRHHVGEGPLHIGELTLRIDVTRERVVVSAPGAVFVLAYATGERIRRIRVEGTASTMLVHGSRAYLSMDGVLACVDLDEGRELWRNELPGTGYAAAALAIPGRSAQADRSH